jgi:hypothetical protein
MGLQTKLMVFWDVELCNMVDTLPMVTACSSKTDVPTNQNTALTFMA